MTAKKPTVPDQHTLKMAAEISSLRALLASTDDERMRFQRELQSCDDRLRNSEKIRHDVEKLNRDIIEDKGKLRRMVVVFSNGATTSIIYSKYIQRGAHRFLQENGNWLHINEANVLYMEETK